MSKTKQIRHATPESRDMLFTMLETLPGALFVIDDAATILYANASAQTLTGTSREDICGKSLWCGAPHLVSAALYQAVQKTTQTRVSTEVEYRSPATGNWLHVQLSPTVGGLMVQVHQGKREVQVLQNECLSIEDLDGFYNGFVILTPEGIVLEINEVPLAQIHIQREEVIGHPLAEARWWSFYPTSQEQLRDAIARASRGETVHFETAVHPREGVDCYLEVAITPHRDQDHHITYLVLTGINITALKRAEAEIYALIDALPQMVWTTKPDGPADSCNQRWRDYTGQSTAESLGEGWIQCAHPEDRQRIFSLWQRALQTGETYETEARLRQHTTGEYRWFLARALPVRDENGQIVKWFGTSTDIEGQVQIEEALRQSQKRVNVLMNSSMIGIFVDEGDQIVDANETFLHMTGYNRADLLAGRMNWSCMTPPDYLTQALQAQQELATQQSITYEQEYVCQDGSHIPVLVGQVILQHHPSQTIGFVLDNSVRKELDQRKDTFISMASHELRNPLTALKLQTSLFHRQLARQGTLDQVPALASMETQINKIIRLVEELLDVSKIQEGKLEYVREIVDLDELVREIAATMQQTHPGHRILVHGSVRTSLMGDRDRLGQVFTNLLSNAIKYAPSAEPIEMDLSASEEAVTVRVTDHGLGIPREQRDKIFERFYRAAASQQKAIPGLGMGLYIVAEIVKGHGGTITVDSEVGKGSTFTVILPRTHDA